MIKKYLLVFFMIFALLFAVACAEDNKEDNNDNKQNEAIHEYIVTFVVDGKKTEVKVKDGEKVSKPSDPVKEGYTFVGWSTTLNGEVVYRPVIDDEEGETIKVGQATIIGLYNYEKYFSLIKSIGISCPVHKRKASAP